jgi:alpha-tubulin suppressor-like RCC1 family protein
VRFKNVTAISADCYHNLLALEEDGSVWAWRDDPFGQLGVGPDGCTSENEPGQVEMLSGIESVSAGNLTSSAS